MESGDVFQGLHFVLDKKKCKGLKKCLEKIRHLFGAEVELEDVFHQNGETKQWICIKAEESNAKRAKDYIVAFTSPDETLKLKNIWGHPLFTITKRDSIEKTTCAVLSKGYDDSLEIKGTELSVMLAQSMIDDIFSKNFNVNDGSQDTGDVLDNGMTRKDFLDEIVVDDEEGQNDCILLETERGKEHGKTSLNQNNSAFAPLVCQTMAVSSLLGPQYSGGNFSDTAQRTSSSQHNKFNSNTTTPNNYDPDHTPLWRPVSDNPEGPLHVRQSDRSKQLFSEKQQLSCNTSWTSHAETGCNSVFASASAVSPSNKSGQYSIANTDCLIMNQKGDGSALKTNSYFPCQRLLHGDNGCEEMEICGPDIVSKPHAEDKAKEQERYLRDLGRNLHYSEGDIEKGLNVYNMDDIIKPADFIETLNNVKTQRHGGDFHNKQKGRTKTLPDPAAAEVISDMDDSVICVGSVSKDVGSIQISSGVASAQADEAEESDLDDSVICTETVSNKVRTITISSEDEVRVISPPAGTEQKRNRRRPRTRKEIADNVSVSNGEVAGHQAAVINVNPVTERVPVYDEDQSQRNLFPEPAPPRAFRRDLRYIIIDGSNVAMAHGNNRVFSVEGLRICINYFKDRGHDRITAFVPETRRYSGNQTPITGRQLLEKLNKDGYVKFTPARRCHGRGKMVVSYDDRYILNLAEKEEGIVVSNDQFRDLCQERHTYLRIVETRLLPFMFVGDHFMPPDDPLGRHGPHLDQFLQTNMVQQRYQPPTFPRPYTETQFPQLLTPNVPSARPKVLMEKYSNVVSKKPGKKSSSQGNGIKEDDMKSQPVRSRDVTEQLFEKLAQVFSEPQQKSKIRTVLNNHKAETDLHRLTNYCMSAIF